MDDTLFIQAEVGPKPSLLACLSHIFNFPRIQISKNLKGSHYFNLDKTVYRVCVLGHLGITYVRHLHHLGPVATSG